MADLLMEVGTEDMPANAVAGALEQFRRAFDSRLAEARLRADSVEVWGTPRRLIVTASGIPQRQPDEKKQVRGPAKSVAFDAGGNTTGAAIRFARKQGIPVESLIMQSTPQGEYI